MLESVLRHAVYDKEKLIESDSGGPRKEDLVVSTASILRLVVVVSVAVVPSSPCVDGSVVSASPGIDWRIISTATEDRHAGLNLGCEGRHYEYGGQTFSYLI